MTQDPSTIASAPALVVMAAGVGSRFDRRGEGRLKQLEAVGPNDETLLDYTVFDALESGFGRVVFVIRTAIHEEFDRAVGQRISERVPVDYALQELDAGLPDGFALPAGLERTKPWGTGHAVLVAKPMLGGPFAVINADDFYGREAIETLFRALTTETGSVGLPIHHLVGYPLRSTLSAHGPVSRGVCEIDDEGWLVELQSLPEVEIDGEGARYRGPEGPRPVDANRLASMNLFGLQPSFLDQLEAAFRAFLSSLEGEEAWRRAELGLPSVLVDTARVGRARVRVHRAASPWFGITHPDDLPRVRQEIAELIGRGVYPADLWA